MTAQLEDKEARAPPMRPSSCGDLATLGAMVGFAVMMTLDVAPG